MDKVEISRRRVRVSVCGLGRRACDEWLGNAGWQAGEYALYGEHGYIGRCIAPVGCRFLP